MPELLTKVVADDVVLLVAKLASKLTDGWWLFAGCWWLSWLPGWTPGLLPDILFDYS